MWYLNEMPNYTPLELLEITNAIIERYLSIRGLHINSTFTIISRGPTGYILKCGETRIALEKTAEHHLRVKPV